MEGDVISEVSSSFTIILWLTLLVYSHSSRMSGVLSIRGIFDKVYIVDGKQDVPSRNEVRWLVDVVACRHSLEHS